LKEEVVDFFRYKEHFEFFLKLKNFKNKDKKIPLSKIIDQLNVVQNKDMELFENFKGKLFLYQKKNFDIFSRGEKKLYVCPITRKIFDDPGEKGNRIQTTLCQLNFFKFLYCENVLERLQINFNFTKKKSFHLKKSHINNNNQKIYFDFSKKEFQPIDLTYF
jgi:hypothetical protein